MFLITTSFFTLISLPESMEQQISFGIKSLSSFFKKKSYSSVFVLVDENTKRYCHPLLKNVLPTHQLIIVRSGEANKTILTCEAIWSKMLKNKADRNSLLVNLGGGVITDMGGFCASVFMRGIDFLNVPTSLMAMADAAIGGKTAIDFLSYKNTLGGFKAPVLICIDTVFLTTLPTRELNSGAAEVFKHALLQGKRETSQFLLKTFLSFSEQERQTLIKKSVRYKLKVVMLDPFESNLRKQLNLGHTIGHAIESFFLLQKKTILHGEAVALGLVAEAFLAYRFFKLPFESFLRIVFWYDLNFVKPNLKALDFNVLMKIMQKDKKNTKAQIKLVLLEREGHVLLDSQITKSQLLEGMAFLQAF